MSTEQAQADGAKAALEASRQILKILDNIDFPPTEDDKRSMDATRLTALTFAATEIVRRVNPAQGAWILILQHFNLSVLRMLKDGVPGK